MKRRGNTENGFSLIELMVLIGVLGLLTSLTALGPSFVAGQKLTAGSREFMAELHHLRQRAMTARTAASSLGFGLRFEGASAYRTFEFNDNYDAKLNYAYEDVSEEKTPVSLKLGTGTTLTVGAAGNPENATLFFDPRGMPRSADWTPVSSLTYVLHNNQSTRARCIHISTAWIREGAWDSTSSTCNLR